MGPDLGPLGRETDMEKSKALGFAILVAAFAGCKEDCAPAAKLGDFEFTQGNYENAVKQYEKALRADPKCYNVEGKLAEARKKVSAGK